MIFYIRYIKYYCTSVFNRMIADAVYWMQKTAMLSFPLVDFFHIADQTLPFVSLFFFFSKITISGRNVVHCISTMFPQTKITVWHTVLKWPLSPEHGHVLHGYVSLIMRPQQPLLRCVFQSRNIFF